MNLILKIVQGPNAGAEAALLEGVNLKIGKSDECDLILADQSLPDVACELEVTADGVTMLLPDGKKVQMQPFCVRVFETTAIAIGPAEGAWAELKWPVPGEDDNKDPEEDKEAKPVPMTRARKLQIAMLVFLVLVIVLEFALWFFWPYLNTKMTQVRNWSREKYARMTEDKLKLAAVPIHKRTLKELAMIYKVRVKSDNDRTIMYGNLNTRESRLRLIAQAYSVSPGIHLELTDDETMQTSVQELLNMLTDSSLKIVSMQNRKLALGGSINGMNNLNEVLKAINSDVPHIEKIDCSAVSVNIPVRKAAKLPGIKVFTKKTTEKTTPAPQGESLGKKPEVLPLIDNLKQQPIPKSADTYKKLPIVGILTRPYPCLVLRNGTRVMEGAEFLGYVVERINDDVIILRNGDITFEWRP